jgi:hypothetical protein
MVSFMADWQAESGHLPSFPAGPKKPSLLMANTAPAPLERAMAVMAAMSSGVSMGYPQKKGSLFQQNNACAFEGGLLFNRARPCSISPNNS